MTKGHHDKKKFIDEIKEQYKADVDISKVQHSWGKVIPFCGDSQCVLHTFNKPVRGSFPMTYVNVQRTEPVGALGPMILGTGWREARGVMYR